MRIAEKNVKWLIVLGGILLFFPFLGSVHLFDWDEINFAECAREMLLTGDVLTVQMNFTRFTEKPPLFIWISALSMKTLGVNEFAARFPNALCGIITLLVIYRTGKRSGGERFALLWVLCYAGSFLPQFYFHSGIIDPVFNLFVFLGIDAFTRYRLEISEERKGVRSLLLSGLYIGLALLTKGPVAVVIYFFVNMTYMALKKFTVRVVPKDILILVTTIAVIGGSWFVMLFLGGKREWLMHFVRYQIQLFTQEDSGHGGPFYYHILVLMVGCFPASVFALRSLFRKNSPDSRFGDYARWMQIFFWVVLIFFSVVKTKIIHYSSMAYFPLTFFAAMTLNELVGQKIIWRRWMNIVIILIGGLWSLVLIVLPLVENYKVQIRNSGMIHDEFALANLATPVQWSGLEWIPGVALLILVIAAVVLFRKGKFSFITSFLAGCSMVIATVVMFVVPKVEKYTQGAAIEFYSEHSADTCYVAALSYHSYAQYYYGKRQPCENKDKLSTDWYLRGQIDRPAYFVARGEEGISERYPDLMKIGSKSGWIFYRRAGFPN
jgi:hypothetical protein